MKYTQQDIWAIFIANYHFSETFDPDVYPGAEFNRQTTIADWIDYCDLIQPKKLAKVCYDEFALTSPYTEFKLFISQSHHTLWDLCDYIARYAKRPVIEPVYLGGKISPTASIFTTLKKQLVKTGANVEKLTLSSRLADYEYLAHLVNETNKIAPNTLTEFIYEENQLVKKSSIFNLVGLLYCLVLYVIHQFFPLSPLYLCTVLIPFLLAYILAKIGKRLASKTLIIGHCETVRELVDKIQQRLTAEKKGWV